MPKKSLSDTHIQEFLAIPSGSEDDQDSSDAESDDDIAKIRTTVDLLCEPHSDSEHGLSPTRYELHTPLLSSNGDLDDPIVNPGVNNDETLLQQISNPQPSTASSAMSRPTRNSSTTFSSMRRAAPRYVASVIRPKKRKIIWKKKPFQPTVREFTGNTDLEPPITELETPLQYFLYFFDGDILNHIVEEMHKFSIQKNPSKPFSITVTELKKYLGICLIMGIARNYNQHMGGVDLLDSFLGKYKIKMRTKKWYLRLFYHFLDIVAINCWLLYRRVGEQKQMPTPLKLKDFKFEMAKSLCMCGPTIHKKRGRPSSANDDQIEMKRRKANVAILPPRDVRLDGCEHFPLWKEKRQRCKYPGCKGKTFISCEKCRVELCLNKDNNCFKRFHE